MPGLTAAPASALRVTPVDDVARWDRFVRDSDGGTLCHLAGWREVMADVLGHQTLLWAAEDAEGEWRGVLPLVRVRSRLTGHFLVSMPFLNDGGPLGDEKARALLAAHAHAEARRCGAGVLEMRVRAPLAFPADTAPPRKVVRYLPLPATEEELWETGFRAKLRSQIRRPMKEGMEFRCGDGEADAFYAVFARNMRDLGTPVLPRAWFAAMARRFPGHVLFAAVYRGDVPVAGACCLLFGGEMEITWASSLREHNAASPNMLLYWGVMREAIARGMRVFSFGRCTPGGSTHRFKEQWGGTDATLPWIAWSPGGEAGTPSPDGRGYRLAVRAWQRLPLAVANRLGPALSRHFP
ncbi:FemAB family XrtA/PEP-CTERM system-associated protein [Longimicrobium sp.]|uniref:FemAB family XrtA/PEP-CTERM system-associated protein n=1 Tax=Longimicrobium sp. TaxID=2029185 RepID=UPI002CA5C772|nr:FemAB family XrtA/PEP-CTERM system-associated protein [Longimicrobium sp.]HSU13300.1 FemAB family XrtA/PEP-CTERM system-associated protein [Longimicrobium sp.]